MIGDDDNTDDGIDLDGNESNQCKRLRKCTGQDENI